MRFFLLFLLSILCFGQSEAAENTQFFVEPEAGRAPLLSAIQSAKKEIDVVMYLWTDRKIAKALEAASGRGVLVKVLLEKSPYEGETANQWLPDFWKGSGIQWQWVPMSSSPLNYFHEKSLLIDHQNLWIMTLNFVKSSFNPRYPVRNFMLEDEAPEDVAAAQEIFDQDWQGKKVSELSDSRLVVSPLNSRRVLESLVKSAKSSLEIYTDGIDDYDFIGDLAKAARHGVKVQIICGGKLQAKAKKYLTEAGVSLKQLDENASLRNHAKAMLVDETVVFVGSENFTQNSFENNRELGVVLKDPRIAEKFREQFLRDEASSSSRGMRSMTL